MTEMIKEVMVIMIVNEMITEVNGDDDRWMIFFIFF